MTTVRQRLRALLAEEGQECDDLFAATGYWRRSHGGGNVRWEAWNQHGKHIVSYDTMTECVKKGITIRDYGARDNIWIDAKS